MPGPAHANEKSLQTWLQIPQGFADNLPEVPASSAIVTASEEVPQVQDLEVDLSKIDLADLVWGWEKNALNTGEGSQMWPQEVLGYVRLCQACQSLVWKYSMLAPCSLAAGGAAAQLHWRRATFVGQILQGALVRRWRAPVGGVYLPGGLGSRRR